MAKSVNIVGLAVAVLAVAVMVTLVRSIQPDVLQHKATLFIKQQFHRNLVVRGSMQWSYFPWLGLKATDLTLSNPPDFHKAAFIEIGELKIRLKLLPLFFKKIEIGQITLKNCKLNLIQLGAETNNWQDLRASDKPANTPEIPNIKIGNLRIINGKITWKNLLNNHTLVIQQLNLNSQQVNFTEPFPIILNLNFDTLQTGGSLALKGFFTCKPQEHIYRAQDFRVTANITNKKLPDTVAMSLHADFASNLATQTLAIDNFYLTIANLQAQGSLHGTKIFTAPEFIGTLNIPTFNPKPLLKKLGYQVPKNSWHNLSLATTLKTTSKFIKIPKLVATLDNTTLQGSASYTHFDDKNLLFNLKSNLLDVDKLVLTKTKASKISTQATAPSDSSLHLEGDVTIEKLITNQLAITNLQAAITGTPQVLHINPTGSLYGGTLVGHLTIADNITTNLKLNNVSLQDLLNTEKLTGTLAGHLNLTQRPQGLFGTTKLTINNGIIHGIDIPYYIAQADALLKHNPAPALPSTPQTSFGNLSATWLINNSNASTHDFLILAPTFKMTGSGNLDLKQQLLDFSFKTYPNKRNFYIPLKVTNTLQDPKITPDLAVLVTQVINKIIPQELNKLLRKL